MPDLLVGTGSPCHYWVCLFLAAFCLTLDRGYRTGLILLMGLGIVGTLPCFAIIITSMVSVSQIRVFIPGLNAKEND